jgi:hypothetical protein
MACSLIGGALLAVHSLLDSGDVAPLEDIGEHLICSHHGLKPRVTEYVVSRWADASA